LGKYFNEEEFDRSSFEHADHFVFIAHLLHQSHSKP